MITVCPVTSSRAKARQHRQEQAPLVLRREVPRLGCHDCEGRADGFELILRRLEGAQLSGAERTPAASEETHERSVAAQLLGGAETAVGVWQEESGAVSPTFNACDATSVSRSQPTSGTQSAALNVVNSSVRIWVSVLSVWFGIGKASGCGSIGRK